MNEKVKEWGWLLKGADVEELFAGADDDDALVIPGTSLEVETHPHNENYVFISWEDVSDSCIMVEPEKEGQLVREWAEDFPSIKVKWGIISTER